MFDPITNTLTVKQTVNLGNSMKMKRPPHVTSVELVKQLIKISKITRHQAIISYTHI